MSRYRVQVPTLDDGWVGGKVDHREMFRRIGITKISWNHGTTSFEHGNSHTWVVECEEKHLTALTLMDSRIKTHCLG